MEQESNSLCWDKAFLVSVTKPMLPLNKKQRQGTEIHNKAMITVNKNISMSNYIIVEKPLQLFMMT